MFRLLINRTSNNVGLGYNINSFFYTVKFDVISSDLEKEPIVCAYSWLNIILLFSRYHPATSIIIISVLALLYVGISAAGFLRYSRL